MVPGQPDLMSGPFAPRRFKVREVSGSLVVPPNALIRDGADRCARRVRRRRRQGGAADVTVGPEVNDAVDRALVAGEVVVLDPPSALGPGTPVQVDSGAKSAAPAAQAGPSHVSSDLRSSNRSSPR